MSIQRRVFGIPAMAQMLLVVFLARVGASNSGDCGEFGHACVNETHFVMCLEISDGVLIQYGNQQGCPQGLVCGHSLFICADPGPTAEPETTGTTGEPENTGTDGELQPTYIDGEPQITGTSGEPQNTGAIVQHQTTTGHLETEIATNPGHQNGLLHTNTPDNSKQSKELPEPSTGQQVEIFQPNLTVHPVESEFLQPAPSDSPQEPGLLQPNIPEFPQLDILQPNPSANPNQPGFLQPNIPEFPQLDLLQPNPSADSDQTGLPQPNIPEFPQLGVFQPNPSDDPEHPDSPQQSSVVHTTPSTVLDAFSCPGTGLFPAPPSCTQFHVCFRSRWLQKYHVATCWPGSEFSPSRRRCIPRFLSDCGRPAIWGSDTESESRDSEDSRESEESQEDDDNDSSE